MATLQKFKLLAGQCAVAGSPTRSPTTSPVIHLRRRKTLRMLLSRTAPSGRRLPPREGSPDRQETADDPPRKTKDRLVARHKLKDLFVSSPPPLQDRASEKSSDVGERLLPATSGAGGGGPARRGGAGSLRPSSAAFRIRLLRRPWRPVLVTIDE
ncbi:uncharacterized protein LOC131144866 [Malania oleifera]|uniref:uncharacterized protein LOC131144866 n=1 Tax=Malania oleifera TaxID=397392 RepID=UPI0025AEAFD2|nr:uncharacterized protein LOC131144866 [Malania oleifera]XP_057949774.1 uncharacterized protein LOC131144866 [Malania oleifera]